MSTERVEVLELAGPDLATFVADHYDRLLRLARLICRDGPDAADAVQIALEQAWRRRTTLRDDGRVRPWLDRIVVREAVRVARARRSWLGRFLSQAAGVAWTEPAHHPVDSLSDVGALGTAFRHLSAEQRAVVALHLYLGYSVDETADLVAAPAETVRSRLRLAKERLRRELGERDQ